MSELISGKEALIALGNNQEVEFIDGRQVWENLKDNKNMDLSMFLDTPDWCKFRLRPRTITLNGIEVPAPFKPKLGERYYVLQPCNESGWMGGDCADMEFDKTWSQFGAWHTKDEIKQVVSALRSIFK